MSRKKTPVCDRDCFNCKFPDCILDELDYKDYMELSELDKDLSMTPEKRKVAAQQRAWYEANKDKVAAQQRAYREANKKKPRQARQTPDRAKADQSKTQKAVGL